MKALQKRKKYLVLTFHFFTKPPDVKTATFYNISTIKA